MTAEALVMNKSAVAMAADSTVTISSGRQGIKTFDTVNKLFELVKGQPIGIMVYANAELNGMPWETIVKAYRSENHGLKLPHVADYVVHFSDFLKRSRDLITEQSEVRVVVNNAYNALLGVFEYVRENQKSCVTSTGKIIMTKVRALVDAGIDLCEETLSEIPPADWSNDLGPERVISRYGSAIRALIDELFDGYGLTRGTKARLLNFAVSYITKDVYDAGTSGVVFAGFGDRDYLPHMYSAQVRGFLAGKVRVESEVSVQITTDYPGHIHTFAQDEEAQAYLTGITPEIRQQIVGFWSSWIDDPDQEIGKVLEEFDNIADSDKAAIAKALRKLAHKKLHDFVDHMNEHTANQLLRPIWESIGFLPKDELGIIAESLVNLTSFKQRISISNIQTVGGAIDVALISRGDGFIWLRRKHYFDLQLNPAWHLMHNGLAMVAESPRPSTKSNSHPTANTGQRSER